MLPIEIVPMGISVRKPRGSTTYIVADLGREDDFVHSRVSVDPEHVLVLDEAEPGRLQLIKKGTLVVVSGPKFREVNLRF